MFGRLPKDVITLIGGLLDKKSNYNFVFAIKPVFVYSNDVVSSSMVIPESDLIKNCNWHRLLDMVLVPETLVLQCETHYSESMMRYLQKAIDKKIVKSLHLTLKRNLFCEPHCGYSLAKRFCFSEIRLSYDGQIPGFTNMQGKDTLNCEENWSKVTHVKIPSCKKFILNLDRRGPFRQYGGHDSLKARYCLHIEKSLTDSMICVGDRFRKSEISFNGPSDFSGSMYFYNLRIIGPIPHMPIKELGLHTCTYDVYYSGETKRKLPMIQRLVTDKESKSAFEHLAKEVTVENRLYWFPHEKEM